MSALKCAVYKWGKPNPYRKCPICGEVYFQLRARFGSDKIPCSKCRPPLTFLVDDKIISLPIEEQHKGRIPVEWLYHQLAIKLGISDKLIHIEELPNRDITICPGEYSRRRFKVIITNN